MEEVLLLSQMNPGNKTMISHFCNKFMKEHMLNPNKIKTESMESLKTKLHYMCYMFVGASVHLNMLSLEYENIIILHGKDGPFFPEVEEWWKNNVRSTTY